jgi:hypothetical protein
MTPFEYVFQYHNFTVSDPRMGLNFQTTLSGYNNKFSSEGAAEVRQIVSGLSKKYFKSAAHLPNPFNILNEPRIDPAQHFSLGSLNRAFQSRGSPYEFYHAVRLAFLAGRCTATNADAYSRKWFTNDCVSFAGNYSGVSPATSVYAYALGYTKAQLAQHDFPDFRLSADVVKIPPRKRMEDIAQGDLLLTFAKPDGRGLEWRHIAVVESFTPLSKTEGLLSIAEWGWYIAADHTVRNKKVTLHDGSGAADRSLPKRLKALAPQFKDFHPDSDKLVAFNGTAPGHPPADALRIFFDGSSFDQFESRGWLVAGKPAPN